MRITKVNFYLNRDKSKLESKPVTSLWRKILSSSTLYILLYVCVFSSQLLGQSGLNKTYSNGLGLGFYGIKCYGSELQVLGSIFSEDGTTWNAFIGRIDTNGVLLNWIEWPDTVDSSHLTSQSGISIYLDSVGNMVAGMDDFGGAGASVLLLKAHVADSIVFFKKHDFIGDRAASVYAVTSSDDGYIFVGWSQRPNYNVDVFLLKISFDGETKWAKYYGHSQRDELAFNIEKIDNNEYVIGGTSDTSGYIFAIDSTGNVKWQWIGPDTGIAHYVVRGLNRDASNGDWVYMTIDSKPTAHPDAEWPYPLYAPVFVRRDSAMNLLHAEAIGPYALNHWMPNMIPSRDGGWIGVGVTSNTTDEYISELRSWQARIIKLDNKGKLLWSAQDTAFFHPQFGSTSFMHAIAEAPTGSIYSAGFAEHPQSNGMWRTYGWLLKITADGCIDTLCTTTSLLDQISNLNNSVKVYPNPARGYLIVDVDAESNDRYAELYDLHGRMIAHNSLRAGQNVVLLDAIPGIYVWRVLKKNGQLIGSGKFIIQSE
jgi:hypothetical protein